MLRQHSAAATTVSVTEITGLYLSVTGTNVETYAVETATSGINVKVISDTAPITCGTCTDTPG